MDLVLLTMEGPVSVKDRIICVEDMSIPGWRLHSLKGDRAGFWAVSVSGNWRVVFEFKDGHAYVVNYEDYH